MLIRILFYNLSACNDQSREGVLILNLEQGFIMKDAQSSEVLWQLSFEKLTRINDDNIRIVTLEFTPPDGEKVAVTCSLHARF